jgi:hypothetical membrane protein
VRAGARFEIPAPGTLSISLGRRGLAGLGLGSIAVILAGVTAAALLFQGFTGEAYSPLNHFISELGEISVSRFAWSYNLGIAAGGLGLGLFLILLSPALTGRFRGAFVAVSLVAGISGPLCGLFPMDYHSTHRLVSDVFFLTGGLVAAVFTVWLARVGAAGFPRWLILPGVLVVAVFATFITVYATGYHPTDPDAHIVERASVWIVPSLEWASLLALLLWLGCVSVALLRQPES